MPYPIEKTVKSKEPSLPTGLYIVATPIGNLRDITLRGLDTLHDADFIACEDTRVSTKLLSAYSIKKDLLQYHEHNAAGMRPKIIKILESGKSIALITDAGTPLISDPGYKLVKEVSQAGIKVYPIPGACAPITTLMAAGLPSDVFTFRGFLSSKKHSRAEQLQELTPQMGTVLLFESPHRLQESIMHIAQIHPDAHMVIGRELTKKFEEFIRGTAHDIAEKAESLTYKGEIVIALRLESLKTNDDTVEELLRTALKSMRVKDAATVVAEQTGRKKKDIYALALNINEES